MRTVASGRSASSTSLRERKPRMRIASILVLAMAAESPLVARPSPWPLIPAGMWSSWRSEGCPV